MSRRNVTYIKPDEPSFLKEIKEQAGYKEGPTVDTKREDLGPVQDDGEFEERNDEEEPTIVVLQPGDLTAEEATSVKEQIKKEAEEAPADLNKPIVFKAPSKSKRTQEEKEKEAKPKGSKRSSSSQEQDKKSKKLKSKALLSFDEDEEEEENF